MILFFANAVGWIVAHWRIVAVIAALFVLIVGSAIVFNRCKKQPKIDLETVNKINNANERERKEELRKTVEQNQDVIKTVDNRTDLQNVNVVEKAREIDERVKAADKAIVEAKAQGKDIDSQTLECILTGNQC